MSVYSNIIGLDPQEVFNNDKIRMNSDAGQYASSDPIFKPGEFIDCYYKRERGSHETWIACDVKIKDSMIAMLLDELKPTLVSKGSTLQDFSSYNNDEIIYSEDLEDHLQFRILKQDNSLFLCFTKFTNQ
jgi:hypothetical protein